MHFCCLGSRRGLLLFSLEDCFFPCVFLSPRSRYQGMLFLEKTAKKHTENLTRRCKIGATLECLGGIILIIIHVIGNH